MKILISLCSTPSQLLEQIKGKNFLGKFQEENVKYDHSLLSTIESNLDWISQAGINEAWLMRVCKRALLESVTGHSSQRFSDFRASQLRDFPSLDDTSLYTVLQDLRHLYHDNKETNKEVKKFNFAGHSYSKVKSHLQSLVADWEKKNSVKYLKESGVRFLQLTPDKVWFDLETNCSEEEKAAMGHCGCDKSAKTLLSFREHVGSGKWQPCLTFAQLKNGKLTQMKGRNNQKPDKKYHDDIAPLLLDDRIKGILTSPYHPWLDFSILDFISEGRMDLFNLVKSKKSLWTYEVEVEYDLMHGKGKVWKDYGDMKWFEVELTDQYVYLVYGEGDNAEPLEKGDIMFSLRKQVGGIWKSVVRAGLVGGKLHFDRVYTKYQTEISDLLLDSKVKTCDLHHLPKETVEHLLENKPSLNYQLEVEMDFRNGKGKELKTYSDGSKWFEIVLISYYNDRLEKGMSIVSLRSPKNGKWTKLTESGIFGVRVAFDMGYESQISDLIRIKNLDPGHFILLDNETVKDTKTGLVWARNPEPEMTYDEAVKFKSGWRLPTIKELMTLISNYGWKYRIDPIFNTESSDFWSSSPYADFSDFAWLVDFGYGHVSNYDRGDGFAVRLVRGGQLDTRKVSMEEVDKWKKELGL